MQYSQSSLPRNHIRYERKARKQCKRTHNKPRVSPGTAHEASLASHSTFSRHSDSFHHHSSREHSLWSFWHKLAHRNGRHSHCNVGNHHKTSKAVALASAITALVSKWRVEPLRAAGTRALAGRLHRALPGPSRLYHLSFTCSTNSRTHMKHFLALNPMGCSKMRYTVGACVFLELWLTQPWTQRTHARVPPAARRAASTGTHGNGAIPSVDGRRRVLVAVVGWMATGVHDCDG